MKNKALAIFGIVTYILSVLSSAENSEGNYIAPIALIAISGIATVVFYVIAAIRLWKIHKIAVILFITSLFIYVLLLIIQGITSPSYGSSTIILLNITKVIKLVAFIWVIVLLWKTTRQLEKMRKKVLSSPNSTSRN
ncbi:MAG: hypothetical protein A2Y65_07945 [Deltaproteobacteria bacterium RBG_13_52_11]|nr:MAG: hypothetical protein A2Y65_07945 [Deltaproteobacteria bacterium RBG_13_52_11]